MSEDEPENTKKLIEIILEKNKKYSREQIKFTAYCKDKMNDRGINEELVMSTILSGKELYYAKIQKIQHKGEIEIRYQIIYKISSKYSLIIIIAYHESLLNVINVIKTSKTAEKLWRKKISK